MTGGFSSNTEVCLPPLYRKVFPILQNYLWRSPEAYHVLSKLPALDAETCDKHRVSPITTRTMLLYLTSRMQDRRCVQTQEQISHGTGFSERQVRRATTALQEMNVISMTIRRNHPTTYRYESVTGKSFIKKYLDNDVPPNDYMILSHAAARKNLTAIELAELLCCTSQHINRVLAKNGFKARRAKRTTVSGTEPLREPGCPVGGGLNEPGCPPIQSTTTKERKELYVGGGCAPAQENPSRKHQEKIMVDSSSVWKHSSHAPYFDEEPTFPYVSRLAYESDAALAARWDERNYDEEELFTRHRPEKKVKARSLKFIDDWTNGDLVKEFISRWNASIGFTPGLHSSVGGFHTNLKRLKNEGATNITLLAVMEVLISRIRSGEDKFPSGHNPWGVFIARYGRNAERAESLLASNEPIDNSPSEALLAFFESPIE